MFRYAARRSSASTPEGIRSRRKVALVVQSGPRGRHRGLGGPRARWNSRDGGLTPELQGSRTRITQPVPFTFVAARRRFASVVVAAAEMTWDGAVAFRDRGHGDRWSGGVRWPGRAH